MLQLNAMVNIVFSVEFSLSLWPQLDVNAILALACNIFSSIWAQYIEANAQSEEVHTIILAFMLP